MNEIGKMTQNDMIAWLCFKGQGFQIFFFLQFSGFHIRHFKDDGHNISKAHRVEHI